jgi:hypothetical protein
MVPIADAYVTARRPLNRNVTDASCYFASCSILLLCMWTCAMRKTYNPTQLQPCSR